MCIESRLTINDDMTIDSSGPIYNLAFYCRTIPTYIKFNIINGALDIGGILNNDLNYGPNTIMGNFYSGGAGIQNMILRNYIKRTIICGEVFY